MDITATALEKFFENVEKKWIKDPNYLPLHIKLFSDFSGELVDREGDNYESWNNFEELARIVEMYQTITLD